VNCRRHLDHSRQYLHLLRQLRILVLR
jgi:hypothetical protein